MAIGLEALRAEFPGLEFGEPSDGVLELVIANEGSQNSATEAMHRELANVWRAIDAEAGIRAVLVRGAGGHFSSGGDFGMIERMIGTRRRCCASGAKRVILSTTSSIAASRSFLPSGARRSGPDSRLRSSPMSRSRAAMRRSSTATRASESRPATIP